MPLVKVNSDRNGRLQCDLGALQAALADLPPVAPVIILIHGYKFSPATQLTDPHDHILSLTPRPGCRKAISWPRHLGFGRGTHDEGLCIAFGWEARGSLWQAWDSAARAGAALAGLIGQIGGLRDGKVDVLGHSLAARVALAALAALPEGSIGRLVLLAAAEFQSAASAALAAPAGRDAEVINITTRENDVFDSLLEWLIRATERGDRALGAGLGAPARNWLDVQIDCADTRRSLASLGFRVPPPSRRVCHWSPYLRPGLFSFYAGLIRDPQRLSLTALRRALPADTAPRWSRLLTLPALRLPLSVARKASL